MRFLAKLPGGEPRSRAIDRRLSDLLFLLRGNCR